MSIQLKKASIEDCPQIHQMQVESFSALLEKYHDLDTNPGAEPLSRVVERMQQSFTDYYFIQLDQVQIGVIRVVRRAEDVCGVAPIFVLPDFQGYGYAQEAMLATERLYPKATLWQLSTILQEEKLCHLYEKVGYHRTGEWKNIQSGMDIVYYEKLKQHIE
jgi:GNAT superfamily N-acetyltransferase